MKQKDCISPVHVAGNVKKRDSNIELFRIIAMLLIVAHHYIVNSGLLDVIYADSLSGKSIFLLLFGGWGKIGINCFMLITGYFMCKSEITVKKYLKLLGEIYFYIILINGIFWISGYETFNIKTFVKRILPVTEVAQNFTGCYLLFFLAIPFLNILIRNLTEKQHIRLIVLCALIYVFFGTVPFFSVTMNYVSWFAVLYFIASYIRLYPKQIFERKKVWGWMTFIFVGLSCVSVIACAWLGKRLGRNMAYYFVTDSNTLLAVCTAISGFLLFKNIKVPYNKWINRVAATTYGVLLIHANSDTMRRWLWQDVLKNIGAYSGQWTIIHAFGCVVGVFVVCSLLDMIRINTVEPVYLKMLDKWLPKVVGKYRQAERSICERWKINNETEPKA